MGKSLNEILELNDIKLNKDLNDRLLNLEFDEDFIFAEKVKEEVDYPNPDGGKDYPFPFIKKELDCYIFTSEMDILKLIPENPLFTLDHLVYLGNDLFNLTSYDNKGNISRIS